ncbi:carbohydrate sulfotransferase 11-like [Ptychodera flava]|uniref:carbohydrate sulfotransferase 11-like n=1 Tax=Ptychodera flava TaxID=63121 RepID=UPI00396A1C64
MARNRLLFTVFFSFCVVCITILGIYFGRFDRVTVSSFALLEPWIAHSSSKLEVSLEKTQQERKALIKETCEMFPAKFHFDAVKNISQFFVEDNHGILFCSVPKVASSNWKRILGFLRNKTNINNWLHQKRIHEGDFVRRLDSYTPQEKKIRLQSYTKFFFVREPMERLLSAFRSKFRNDKNKYFPARYGKEITKRYRKDRPPEFVNTGNDVSFDEFLRYLVDPKTVKRHPFNAHWRQYYELCYPCHIQYDFIGKYETLLIDAQSVLKLTNADEFVSFPPGTQRTGKTYNLVADYYGKIPKDVIEKLYDLYKIDYTMFGYSWPKQLCS